MVYIIGLSGYSEASRNQIAEILTEYLGPNLSERVSFNDKLFEFAIKSNALCEVDIFDHRGFSDILESFGNDYKKARKEVPELRRTLSKISEAAKSTFGEDFWIQQTLTNSDKSKKYLIITDVKYPAEAQRIVDNGGKIFFIEQKGVEPSSQIESSMINLIKKKSLFSRTISWSPSREALEIQIKSMIWSKQFF